ncbi:MAG: lanthionine synthetase LanC family protein, partial [Lachnospiraceae bacterium]
IGCFCWTLSGRFLRALTRLPELLQNVVQKNISSKDTVVRDIADYLCSNAMIFDSDISWDSIVYFDDKTWKMAPMDLDLYDGLGGIAIFFASVNRTYSEDRYREIFELVCKKLFAYTNYNGDSAQKYRTKNSGLFKGEGSIVYTYLILYKITGKREFLTYAERHYAHFEKLFLQCETMDYLSGDAGAIIVLTKLYSETDNRKYLDAAEMLGEKIWKMSKKQKEGYGIVGDHDDLPPLAGMSHGTSGYIMAYAYLYEKNQSPEYYERIIELLTYEKSLFDPENGNWKDLRKTGEEKNTTAWCHGAPGIAMARLKLSSMEIFRNAGKVEKDIDKCLSAFERNRKNDSLCLCHGLAGNYWIEKYLLERKGINDEQKIRENLIEILNRVKIFSGMLPRERYNVSMMTGITGIGLLLNDELLCRYIFG